MKRIEKLFNALKSANRKALATFVTAGDPDLNTTKELVRTMIAKGADIIELGIPYSDPIAEGPVIQAANVRAMKNKISVADVFKLVKEVRSDGMEAPLLFLLYYNVVFQYGIDRFLTACAESGVDGLIIPDLPFEEQGELKPQCIKYGVDLITMVSPVSEERIGKLVKNADGFLYCVSSLGVTGVRTSFQTDFGKFMKQIEAYSSLPKMIGFGVSTPEQVKSLKEFADGVIVGSAIVKRVGDAATPEKAVKEVGIFVDELRNSLN
ncbi:MAG: tryptophan synthase subunit alpha [Fibrobacteres bacterium]|nr:tryptophan synthase subunit alpha [Fibrobacterota bacterium]